MVSGLQAHFQIMTLQTLSVISSSHSLIRLIRLLYVASYNEKSGYISGSKVTFPV